MKKLVIGILAHVDAGKTTLSEELLYLCGEIRKIGRVDHGDAFLDTYELEKERGITIFSKQALLTAGRTDITLPASQRDLLKELKKTGKPIGLVLMNGRPLELTWEDENMDAILEAWYPGTMGGHAIADVIAGDYNPAGKLTMSFPRSVGQLPLYYNHKNTGRPLPPDNPKMDYKSSYIDCPNSPLYPFGYGLSYTSFEVDNLKLDKEELKKGETLTVTVDVANIGKVGGEEVVQLYIRDLVGSVTRPVKELKGFQKLYLKAGEKKSLTFVLTEEDLAFCGADMKMQVEPGEFRLWVGTSSADERNESVFTLI